MNNNIKSRLPVNSTGHLLLSVGHLVGHSTSVHDNTNMRLLPDIVAIPFLAVGVLGEF